MEHSDLTTTPTRAASPTDDRVAIWSTAAVVVAFGVAMGYVEAAVVVYLRSAMQTGSAVLAQDPAAFRMFEGIEFARELATLVMIAAVGWLAGRTRLERLAWAAVVFGAWDIVYYAVLRTVVGWPPSPVAWDILFLVPVPWVGPVWAPLVVSAALVGFGLAAARRLRAGRRIVVGPLRALAGLAGGGLVVLSFLVDSDRVLAGDESAWTGWPLFGAGMALAIGATAAALVGASSERHE
jgi:membrane-associated protease RseP (regulator of RpoE activity)